MVINWTPPAIQDLHEFYEYTKMTNANGYISDLVQSTNILIDNPNLGKIYDYIKKHIIRQFIHNQHRIFYYIDNDTIHIIAVVHHKQDIRKKINSIKKKLL